jgi:Cys-rich repeat protein
LASRRKLSYTTTVRVGIGAVAFALVVAGCWHDKLVLLPEQHSLGVSARDSGRVDSGADDEFGSASGMPCTESEQCNSQQPHCDVTTGRCVECLSPAHCDPPRTCDLVSKTCAAPCNEDDDCGRQTPRCDSQRGVCVECLDDSSCDSQDEQFCQPLLEECVECLKDANCGPGQPICDPTRYRCVECLSDADCPDGARCVEQSCSSH